MNKRLLVLITFALFFLTAGYLTAILAADPAPATWKSIEESYAVADAELAEARLALAMSQKSSIGGSVSEDLLDQLKAGVDLTHARLIQAKSGGNDANPFAPQIAAARVDLSGLEADHVKSLESNKLAAGSVSDLELRNEVAQIKVAKARLAALQSLAQQPPEVRMQWQINELHDQIRALWARPLIED